MRKWLYVSVSLIILICLVYFGFQVFPSKKFEIVDKDWKGQAILPYKAVTSYSAYDNNIYMSIADRWARKMANKVVEYNRKTQKTKTLFKSKFKDAYIDGVKVNRNWITWVDSDDMREQQNIYVMNKKTRKITAIDEFDGRIRNMNPVLDGDYLAWISKKGEQAAIIVRNLNTGEETDVFHLNALSSVNKGLSMRNGKLLFIDNNNHKGYCYLYDVSKQKLEAFETPYESVGWVQLLNNHQFLYLNSKPEHFSENKLVFVDVGMRQVKVFPSRYTDIILLEVDQKNHVFVSRGDGLEIQKISVDNSNMIESGVIKEKDLFDMKTDNGIYLLKTEPVREGREKLIVSNKMP
ncbi:hypothetical protein ACFO4N_03820 [Camelliibacillus cellulosilyticus]|uniref:Uncharacterized protein n=1 Tax=Camelliibacillus cellulosilyticus TaxID=2174486 RepID=A0ABV9GKY2_9BACL